MDPQTLHKITCLGDILNPFYYCKQTGTLYRQSHYKKSEIRKLTCTDKSGYLRIYYNGVVFPGHVLIAMEFLNHTPSKHITVVDHIDGNKQNNRVENLRLVSNRENVLTGRLVTSKTTQLPHNIRMTRQGYKYLVYFTFNKKQITFGSYSDISTALCVRHEIEQRVIKENQSIQAVKLDLIEAAKIIW